MCALHIFDRIINSTLLCPIVLTFWFFGTVYSSDAQAVEPLYESGCQGLETTGPCPPVVAYSPSPSFYQENVIDVHANQ